MMMVFWWNRARFKYLLFDDRPTEIPKAMSAPSFASSMCISKMTGYLRSASDIRVLDDISEHLIGMQEHMQELVCGCDGAEDFRPTLYEYQPLFLLSI